MIVDLYDSNYSIEKICEITGKNTRYVVNVLRKDSEKFIEDIIKDYKNNHGVRPLSKKFRMSHRVIIKILADNSILRHPSIHRKHDICEDYFENIDTQAKAYFLGFLYTDGSVSSKNSTISLDLNKKDSHILHAFAKEIYKSEYKIGVRHSENSEQLRIYSAKMKSDLAKLGCTPRKTFTIRIPKLRKDLMPHFIRGVFDGDGNIYVSKSGRNSVSIIGNNDFVNDIRTFLIKELSIGCGYLFITKQNDQISTCQWGAKKDIAKIIKYMYHDSFFRLERKFNKASEICREIIL